jgi:Cytoplasmic Fragile-X interacting family
MVEQMLYALDIYNDAARKALYELNSQYLYDEVQAEVNVAYDQLVFQLDSEVYGHYKVSASAATYMRSSLCCLHYGCPQSTLIALTSTLLARACMMLLTALIASARESVQ